MSAPEYFDSDDDDILDMSDEKGDDTLPHSRTHKLSAEDGFSLTMIKLRLGLFNKDLALIFNSVKNILNAKILAPGKCIKLYEKNGNVKV